MIKKSNRSYSYRLDSDKATSRDRASGQDEDSAAMGCDNANESQVHVWSRPEHPQNSLEIPVD